MSQFTQACTYVFIHYYYYRYSALGPVWAETRAQSGDWYGSGMLHPGQILTGSLPLLSPVFIHNPQAFNFIRAMQYRTVFTHIVQVIV
jgi:hypothetical protein